MARCEPFKNKYEGRTMRNARAARVENCERARLGPRHSSRERIDRKKRQGGGKGRKGQEKKRNLAISLDLRSASVL